MHATFMKGRQFVTEAGGPCRLAVRGERTGMTPL